MRTKSTLLLAAALLISTPSIAQDVKVIDDSKWCKDDKSSQIHNGRRSKKHCEVREITLAAGRDVIKIDGRLNGGVSVESWDKDEILVMAKVKTWAKTRDEAYALARNLNIETRNTIQADITKSRNGRGSSVTYRIYVPEDSNLEIKTHNGGVAIADVSGDINFDVLNGGASLINLSGNVKGRTTNGGLKIQLEGTEWDGEKMDVRTTNGGIVLYVPDGYNADLHTGTMNGGINFDFNISTRNISTRNMKVTLGNGGKTIKAYTTNGGVKVKRSNGTLSLLKK